MPTPKDKELYNKAKLEADKIYKKSSAYKSGFIVKKYKELYKKKYGSDKAYIDDKNEKNLKRWFDEKWEDIGEGEYPLYRPTKRINSNTPKTKQELTKSRIKEMDKLKQKIKGKKNLPKF
jgi:hypothetical protein